MSKYKKTDDPGFVSFLEVTFPTVTCTKELAEILDISKKTCQRYLKDLNLHYPKGRPKGKGSVNKKTGGLALWIKSHPGKVLPSKVSEIAKETSLSKDQVKSFLYRLRKKHIQRIRDIGDLRTYNGVLKGTKGSVVLFSDIEQYSLKHSSFNEDLRISAILKNKKRIEFKSTLSRLEMYRKLHKE